MAEGGGEDRDKTKKPDVTNLEVTFESVKNGHAIPPTAKNHAGEGEEDEEEEDDTEPHLKYTKLTSHLNATFKNKDSASTCLTSGDKLIVGTHGGSVYIFSIPSLETLRTYKAHSASVTSISVSPHNCFITARNVDSTGQSTDRPRPPSRAPTVASTSSGLTSSPNSPRNQRTLGGAANSASSSTYIATSSIDGHVCVSAVLDQKDVTLRNFARPVQAVALSPDYRSSRSYLSGGLAGHLILTTGGRQGGKEDANTINAAAAASGWLGQIGLTSSSGRDVILHQGEGSIGAIKWSLSGRFVAWVNETGIKIMRSNCGLGSEDSELAWRRIGHVDRPKRKAWEENGALWKARLEWIDERYLEEEPSIDRKETNGLRKIEKKTEQLLIGWGDTIWILHIYSEGSAPRTGSSKGFKKPDIVHQFKFDDGVVSGLTLYTPKLLLALVYRTRDDENRPISSTQESTPRKGIQKRSNGMQPEMRLVNLASSQSEELEISSLPVDRYQSLSFADYHMSTIFFSAQKYQAKNATTSFATLGDGLIDASRNATRLFSSNASIMSGSSGDQASERRSPSLSQASTLASFGTTSTGSRGLSPAYAKPGLKIFLISPYDTLLGVKRDGSDHLNWLKEQHQYEQAWYYVDENPDVVAPQQQSYYTSSRPQTPSGAQQSLADFLDDDTSSTSSATTMRAKAKLPAVAREKRVIGDMWVRQLVELEKWDSASKTAAKVFDTAERWEYWIQVFIEAEKYDEISQHMPTRRLKPPIPSIYYERLLSHYVNQDRVHLQALLNNWSAELFDIQTVAGAIESKLNSDDPSVQKQAKNDGVSGRDWRMLQDSLAQLYLSANRPADALRCYMLTRNADPAIQLVKENQLYTVISDSVYDFATIRAPTQVSASPSLTELDSISLEPIQLLASAAVQNVIPAGYAIQQFQQNKPDADKYLFFYLRTLWKGELEMDAGTEHIPAQRSRRARFAPTIPTNPTRHLLSDHGDLCVTLFATYDPPLLNALLRARDAAEDVSAGGSIPYSFEHASSVCEAHGLTAELVYLLAATGQSREALRRICEGKASDQGQEDDNVKWAIDFCHEMDDQGLWEDLLGFSLKRPIFLRGLLEATSVGSGRARETDGETLAGIEPIELVQKIPEGLGIPGLKKSLERLLKDADVQKSIAGGAAQVLRTEIAAVMQQLVGGRKKGVAFETQESKSDERVVNASGTKPEDRPKDGSTRSPPTNQTTRCAICDEAYVHDLASPDERDDHLIAYTCGHVFHLNCILDAYTTSTNRRLVDDLQNKLAAAANSLQDGSDAGWRRGRVGSKVGRMQMVGRIIGGRGCIRCERDHRHQDIG